jgi:periplasmic copper chaperone A
MRIATTVLVWLALSAAASSTVLGHEVKLGALRIMHPLCRIVESQPGLAIGMMKIVNTGRSDDTLISAHIEGVGAARFDSATRRGGASRLEALVHGIPLPAGETIVLAPSSMHMRFAKAPRDLPEGTMLQGVLVFEKAGRIDVEFEMGG